MFLPVWLLACLFVCGLVVGVVRIGYFVSESKKYYYYYYYHDNDGGKDGDNDGV